MASMDEMAPVFTDFLFAEDRLMSGFGFWLFAFSALAFSVLDPI